MKNSLIHVLLVLGVIFQLIELCESSPERCCPMSIRTHNLEQSMSGTYTIGHDGADFNTIADAVESLLENGASSDIQFLIMPGQYTESPIQFDRIDMPQESHISFQPSSDQSVEIFFTSTQANDVAMRFHSANRIEFVNPNGSAYSNFVLSVLPESAETPTILVDIQNEFLEQRIKFSNCTLRSGSSELDGSIVVRDEGYMTCFEDCLICRGEIGVLATENSNSLRITNCRIGGNNPSDWISWKGIAVEGSDAFISGSCIRNIYNGISIPPRIYGVFFYNASHITFYNNVIYGVNKYGSSVDSEGQYGIFVDLSSDVQIIHNSVYFRGSDGHILSRCLYVGQSSGITLRNNCFYNIKSSDGLDLAIEVADVVSLVENHNFLSGSDGSVIGFTPDESSVALGDPLFMAENDLHIQIGSACQGIGQYISGFDFDADGNERFDPCDAGAYEIYEHTPGPTPTMTPEPSCPETSIELTMPAHHFSTGDPCALDAVLCSVEPVPEDVNLFVVLQVYGLYFFWPSWQNAESGCDYHPMVLIPGQAKLEILPVFYWPENCGHLENIIFWGCMVDPTESDLIGNIASWSFSYSS